MKNENYFRKEKNTRIHSDMYYECEAMQHHMEWRSNL